MAPVAQAQVWVSPNIGYFRITDATNGLSIGGAVQGAITSFLSLGGRGQVNVDMNPQTESTAVMGENSVMFALTADFLLPLGSSVQLYAGGLMGIDVQISLTEGAASDSGKATLSWGANGGLDLFITPRVSIGIEGLWERLNYSVSQTRYTALATMKFYLGDRGGGASN